MDIDGFWRIIEECRTEGGGGGLFSWFKKESGGGRFGEEWCDKIGAAVERRLKQMPAEEIIEFHLAMDELLDRAYTWELWGAAYVINGGCSDDGFEYFRGWLIAQGREVFERALADPESLADVAEPDVECEALLCAPVKALEAVTGEGTMPRREKAGPSEPKGEKWEEEDLEGRIPRLVGRFG